MGVKHRMVQIAEAPGFSRHTSFSETCQGGRSSEAAHTSGRAKMRHLGVDTPPPHASISTTARAAASSGAAAAMPAAPLPG